MTLVATPASAMPRAIVADRGAWAMWLFIATEATLFVCLFFAYYYLGQGAPVWPPEPPELRLALVMLAVLATSSAVLHAGERAERLERHGRARAAVALTIVLGAVFLAIQAVEFRHRLQTLQPSSSAYGSVFYTITGIHGLHLGLGLLMLAYVLALPEIGPSRKPPHGALHNAALYWHFVDVVWLIIVGLLYVAPHVSR